MATGNDERPSDFGVVPEEAASTLHERLNDFIIGSLNLAKFISLS
jgi:hypothetical protein